MSEETKNKSNDAAWQQIARRVRVVRGEEVLSADVNYYDNHGSSVLPYWSNLIKALFGLGKFFASFSPKENEHGKIRPPKYFTNEFHLDLFGGIYRDSLPATNKDFIGSSWKDSNGKIHSGQLIDIRAIPFIYRKKQKINVGRLVKNLREQSFEIPRRIRSKTFAKQSSLVRRTAHELSKIPQKEYFDKIWFRIAVLYHYFERQGIDYNHTFIEFDENDRGIFPAAHPKPVIVKNEDLDKEISKLEIPNQEKLDNLYFYEPRTAKEWAKNNVKEFKGSSTEEVQEPYEDPINQLSNTQQGLIIGSKVEHSAFGSGILTGHDKSRVTTDRFGNILDFEKIVLYVKFEKVGMKRVLAGFCNITGQLTK